MGIRRLFRYYVFPKNMHIYLLLVSLINNVTNRIYNTVEATGFNGK